MQHRKFNLSTLVVLVLAALFLAACGGSATEASDEVSAVTIEVTQNDLYFGESPDNAENPPTWTVPAGAAVTVALTNNGALEHNWAIIVAGEEVPVPLPENTDDLLLYSTALVDPGSTATAVFTAPEAGEYLVICTVSGHYPTMQGRLIVTG